jgi:hypothetical protein
LPLVVAGNAEPPPAGHALVPRCPTHEAQPVLARLAPCGRHGEEVVERQAACPPKREAAAADPPLRTHLSRAARHGTAPVTEKRLVGGEREHLSLGIPTPGVEASEVEEPHDGFGLGLILNP